MTCATFVDGVWSTGETDFDDNGEVSNLDCALVAVTVPGEATPYWITSRSFEGLVGPSFDLRHAFSTAEAVIAVGSTSIELQDVDFNAVFTGTLTTVSVSAAAVEIEIAAE